MVYFFTLPMRGCIGAGSDGIFLSLVTCRRNARKGGLNGIKKYFDCNSKNYSEVCLCHMQGSILCCKAVFITACTGCKNLSDFCKSGSTAVGKEIFMVRKRYFVLAMCGLFVMTGCSGSLHTQKESAVIMEAESECTDTEKSDKEPETYEEVDIATESVSDLSEDISQTVEDTNIENSENDNTTDKNVSAGDKSAAEEIRTEEKLSEENPVTEAAKTERKETTDMSEEDIKNVSGKERDTDDRCNPADGSPLYEITITKPETEFIGYSADRVTELAILKCKTAGMITLPESLDSMLAAGEITQEEYEEYYPYDGCGYYSVFVETDLNTASAISGRKLGSEEEIADYIAAMMVLEREPYFYIECVGIYKNNGTEFYEFRCYR